MEMKHTESHLQEGALEAWCALQRGMTGLTPQLLLIPQTQHCSCFEGQTGNQDGAPESCSHLDLLKGSCATWHCLSSTDVCAYPNPSCSPSHPLLPPSVPGVLLLIATAPHFYFQAFDLRLRLEHSLVLMETGWKMVIDGEAEESQKCTAGGAALS